VLVTILFTLGAAKAGRSNGGHRNPGHRQSQTATQISAPAPQASARRRLTVSGSDNDMWFAGVGAARALDYASTLNLRRRGSTKFS